MTHYIETQAKDGSIIRIEVEDTSKTGVGFTPKQDRATDVSGETAKDAFNQSLKTINACANGVIDTIQTLDSLPSSASIDFAIKIDAEAGALVAKSKEDAQFRVLLSWKQETDNGEDSE